MPTVQRRIPKECFPAFLGRYTVKSGDNLYKLSQLFRVRMEALAVNNPHIDNPNIIFPGDVLCVPGLIPYPCIIELTPKVDLPFGTGAIVYINFAPRGGQSISFLATLPLPSYLGNYDIYVGKIYIPTVGEFRSQLFPTPEDPPTWSGRIELPTAASITPNSRVTIGPINSKMGISGGIAFEGIINSSSC
ncbi:LysM peptidoglycan-binding domain-containing protein [Alkalibaculum sp. M08DMB]|uniref:LysM peptidoglycan-binding domain-containing protein n=1 Tax=Alkalibaculum sporogenes TaxID=2655001 RepID=A0A6A7K4X9_9FIRM|nr:LysM peptidoglycan-binding domain-containing protein [Alkalibaculum sporogenes]MPW24307.1 LysM peptidoglycan-binding domain-containing protein [Alkalibaculum sporogenes]